CERPETCYRHSRKQEDRLSEIFQAVKTLIRRCLDRSRVSSNHNLPYTTELCFEGCSELCFCRSLNNLLRFCLQHFVERCELLYSVQAYTITIPDTLLTMHRGCTPNTFLRT